MLNFYSRRDFVKGSLALAAALGLPHSSFAKTTANGQLAPAQVLVDMVHNNPGEVPFVTHYNDPQYSANLGYSGKVYELFEGAQFGINWASVDPTILPVGSADRTWVDNKAADLDQKYNAAKAAGLQIYCHTDMVVFPKRLVQKYNIQSTFGDVSNPQTQQLLRAAVQQMFARFPQLDGLIIRIGETYLQGAPYHTGAIADKTNANKTIIPLMTLLREEACTKLNKNIIFRSWYSFDTDVPTYTAVSDGVDPHPNLYVSVKHCEGDFHRGNPFSRVLGIGRHQQTVEVECQREYEGKGAYPNYIAHGVIEGFEEHNGQSIRKIWSNPLLAGIFTWSRGGGWVGPYITNELWCDLNVYVMSKWAQNPNRSEASIFDDFSTKVLKLSAVDRPKFRKLALLSADAVYRGKRDTHNDITPWWSRDDFMDAPPIPGDATAKARVLQEKDEAVQMWTQMLMLARSIRFPDPAVKEYAITSCQYGFLLYSIMRDGFNLAALGTGGDKTRIRAFLADYDRNWAKFRSLKVEHPSCATLYKDTSFKQPAVPPIPNEIGNPGIGAMVDKIRQAVASEREHEGSLTS